MRGSPVGSAASHDPGVDAPQHRGGSPTASAFRPPTGTSKPHRDRPSRHPRPSSVIEASLYVHIQGARSGDGRPDGTAFGRAAHLQPCGRSDLNGGIVGPMHERLPLRARHLRTRWSPRADHRPDYDRARCRRSVVISWDRSRNPARRNVRPRCAMAPATARHRPPARAQHRQTRG
jgi:hypothetical protein